MIWLGASLGTSGRRVKRRMTRSIAADPLAELERPVPTRASGPIRWRVELSEYVVILIAPAYHAEVNDRQIGRHRRKRMDRRSFIAALLGITVATVAGAGAALAQRGAGGGFGARFSAGRERRRERRAARRTRRTARRAARRGM